jgi:processive 1,2-diacylglycerol beta-glucosyltransferase
MKLLFLSLSAGGGHAKAAESLVEYIESNNHDVQTLVIDTLKYINPMINKLVVGSYLSALKNTPKIYEKLYEIAENSDNLTDGNNPINRILSEKLRKLINDYYPDIIICTHPFPTQMVSDLKRRGKINFKIMSIVTDFIAHPIWLYPEVDFYIIADEGMKYDLISKGISPDVIYPYGIPVSSRFSVNYNRNQVRKHFGLKNMTTVLLMGGSLGFGDIEDVFLDLINSSLELQVVVVTGSNHKLKEEIEKYVDISSKPIKILSYTNQIPELMSVSDFIVTKPGGLTISEALVKNLPIILISPIPGQEEKNARFLLNMGAAVRIYEKDNIDIILKQLINNPKRLSHMIEMSKILGKPNAGKDIAQLINNKTDEKNGLVTI